jgi:hypothetical protein
VLAAVLLPPISTSIEATIKLVNSEKLVKKTGSWFALVMYCATATLVAAIALAIVFSSVTLAFAVGSNPGMLSGDVAKSISLGCSAAKAGCLEHTNPLRQEIARAANDPDGSGLVHAHTDGTTLVVESAYFFDDPQSGVTFARAMAQTLLEDSQKLCAAAISQLQMRGSKRVTVPVVCK